MAYNDWSRERFELDLEKNDRFGVVLLRQDNEA
jgi:hypothetical protein